MRKITAILAGLLVTGVLASAAVAANPHFLGDPEANVVGNSLVVSFTAAGLGNETSVPFSLSGDVNVSSRCYTKKGNTPQAANKQESIAVNTTENFAVRNGRTSGSFTVAPLSTLTCPRGQNVVVENITYDLVLSGPGNLSYAISS